MSTRSFAYRQRTGKLRKNLRTSSKKSRRGIERGSGDGPRCTANRVATRDATGDATRGATRDTARDTTRSATRDTARDTTRGATQDTARDTTPLGPSLELKSVRRGQLSSICEELLLVNFDLGKPTWANRKLCGANPPHRPLQARISDDFCPRGRVFSGEGGGRLSVRPSPAASGRSFARGLRRRFVGAPLSLHAGVAWEMGRRVGRGQAI